MKFIFVNIMMGMYRGGGENYDLHVSRELAARGHETECYFLRPVFAPSLLPLPGYCIARPVRAPWLYLWTQRLHGLAVIGRLRGLRGLPRWIGQIAFEINVLARLWRRRRESFVVHICGLSFLGMLATTLLGDRVFVRLPGPPSFRMHLWCLRRTYAVIANGDAFDSIQRSAPEANLIRLEVGIDHSVFRRGASREAARAELGLPNGKVLVLFVGRLIPLKNVQMLVRLMHRVAAIRADVDLVVVGTGPDRADLEQAARELDVRARVHFLGEARGDRLCACYTAADMFVLSSHYDNFPNVILEAMAMELPVVATKVGGVPSQVVENETGYLVEPDDDEAMAARVVALAADVDARLALGKRAGALARTRFDWGRTAERFVEHASRSGSERNG